MNLNLEATEEDIKGMGLEGWYPKTFGAAFTDDVPTIPGWYWFDSGIGNAGLFYLQKRKFKDELYSKVFMKPYAQDGQPNHYWHIKRFIGKWRKADQSLFEPKAD